jgi:hypothetical protein
MPKILPDVKVLDPGKLQFGKDPEKVLIQTSLNFRTEIDLKRETNVTKTSLKSFYRVAPIDTWGFFVSKKD